MTDENDEPNQGISMSTATRDRFESLKPLILKKAPKIERAPAKNEDYLNLLMDIAEANVEGVEL